jgi:tetratricopeptide (TPR) repeat protein
LLWPSDKLLQVQPLIEEAVALGSKLGERWQTAYALLWLGVCHTFQGSYSAARSRLEQSLEIYRQLGDKAHSAWAMLFAGEVDLLEGDNTHAQSLFDQAFVFLTEKKDYSFLAVARRRLGQLAMLRGDLDAANTCIKESLLTNWSIRDYLGVAASLAALGELSMMHTRGAHAAKLFGMVGALFEFVRPPLLPYDQKRYEGNVTALRSQLDERTLIAAQSEGHAMPLDQAVAFALEDKSSD